MNVLERIADHEAGHAAMCFVLDIPLVSVDAIGDATALGRTHHELSDTDEDLVKRMQVILGGLIESADSIDDLPAWPLDADHGTTDQRRIALLAKILHLDRDGYQRVLDDTFALWTSPAYKRVHAAISHALEQYGRLDRPTLDRIKSIVIEGAEMEHATKAATVTATDQGEFTAIAATYTVDRLKDQIIPGAFAETIDRWRASGKRIPLHWDHKGEAHNVIGSIDPATMSETAEGLRVSGKLDIDSSDTAREAWRSMRNGTMSLSFGYITTKRRKRSDGINELHELDLFEISIVPHPANPDTRILEMKSLDDGIDLAAVRQLAHDEMFIYMGGNPAETLRQKSKRIEREFAPIQIASFEV